MRRSVFNHILSAEVIMERRETSIKENGSGANGASGANGHSSPVSYVPVPSAPYRLHRKAAQLTVEPGKPRLKPEPTPIPLPFAFGSRVLMWKQDPSVAEIGTRKTFLPGIVLQGPRDARITFGVPGIPAVSPNAFGDYIMAPNTDQFDAVHTYAVVRQTLTMYQRTLAAASAGEPTPLPWQWNAVGNTDPVQIFPHGLPNVMNAFYSRSAKALKFGDFIPTGATSRVYTCRSFDIVAHETGHAVLDGLKPDWLLASNPPQTGGLHESFGDITAIFLALSQLDQVEAVIAQTKANLHDKTFLADLAEQFGLALGRPNGLRNADNDLKLSQVGTEVHAISQVFTGAIYDILADIFAFEREPGIKDDALVLHGVGEYLRSLVLRALIAAPNTAATYAHVVNQMLQIANADGKPVQYSNFIRNRFTIREVVFSATALTEDHAHGIRLEVDVVDDPNAVQDRRACCGTMTHTEYFDVESILNDELKALSKWCKDHASEQGGSGENAPRYGAKPGAVAGPDKGVGKVARKGAGKGAEKSA
ncbi:MAG: hypothetical protein ACI83P_001490 [Janthinobacterium sp.]|jgi:hypothetical protein